MKKKTPTPENILLIITGGIGKNILATAVVASLKIARPETTITIATAHPLAWENNPDVAATYDLNNCPLLYKNAIKNKLWTIFKHDPYHTEDFMYRRGHLIDIWCKLLGIAPTVREPRLYFTEEEKAKAVALLPKDTGPNKKPIFLIQTSGGVPMQKYPISWARDLPMTTAQKIVNQMNQRGYHTIHIRMQNQPALENVTWINATTRRIMAILPHSEKRLFIDSLPQHAAAALNLPSVVLWIVNSPKMFGYPIHHNIETTASPEFRHYPNSYLEKFDITGAIDQFPFATTEIFDTTAILKELEISNRLMTEKNL